MKRLFLSVMILCGLSACSELELGSHIAKKTVFANNQERPTGYFKVGTPYKIKGRTYRPKEKYQYSETGIASWYGPGFHGKMTANGEIFDQNEFTAAHRTLQMPSMVRVTNLENGKSIILRVNDRGPFAHNRVIDLSKRAAESIDMIRHGTARVRVDVLEKPSRQVASAARRGLSTRGTEIALNRGQKYLGG
jgi:rare lipoprotein A